MSGIEARVTTLEDSVKEVQRELTILNTKADNFATKVDLEKVRVEIEKMHVGILHQMKNHTLWLIGVLISIASVAVAVAKLIF
ncbi:hypothetical protein SODG_001902 [Sodalis praecaptivus]|uniref:hypothetical protein n=1 Tax=Sodalis praecaptivus TaxID=1239307 RepID=UPI0027E6ED57|nr:hypothetical protein [Sodalis praecaptivus]CAJ0991683.1 hypothetical protein NVIRENTERO_00393 [Sodalis praecaptivus]